MKNFKKAKALLLILASAMLLSACGLGKKEITGDDAKKYVDACFKASLKGDVDDYVELTGESKEEVEKQYEESLKSIEDQLSGITGTDADFAEKFTDASKKMLASAKYEVGEAVKDEDGNFMVEVKAYPSDVMTVFVNKIAQSAYNDNIGEVMVQAMNDAVEEQSYGEAVSYQVDLNNDTEQKKYIIDDSDVDEVITGLFAEMEAMFQASGKVFDNPYLNWTKTEWEAASEDDRTQCCIAMVQYLMGLTDEEMATVDLNNADVQASIQQMKDGIDMAYSTSTEISIGDYADYIKNTGVFG